jgi:hypothetical protein
MRRALYGCAGERSESDSIAGVDFWLTNELVKFVRKKGTFLRERKVT